MKLTLESYGKKYSVETEGDDLTIDECLDLMAGLLYQATFSEETIRAGIIELADSFK
jgi:hypothetical protein